MKENLANRRPQLFPLNSARIFQSAIANARGAATKFKPDPPRHRTVI